MNAIRRGNKENWFGTFQPDQSAKPMQYFNGKVKSTFRRIIFLKNINLLKCKFLFIH